MYIIMVKCCTVRSFVSKNVLTHKMVTWVSIINFTEQIKKNVKSAQNRVRERSMLRGRLPRIT